MKNKKLKKFILISICALFLFIISGCSNNSSQNEDETLIQNSISEYRKNLFVGKGSSFLATFSSGEREENYVMDGEKSKLVNFGVITIKFDNNPESAKPQFELKVNSNTYAGELEKNPYDNTYVFDIENQVENKDILTLYLVDFDEYITLDCWSQNWQYGYKDALKVFTNKYSQQITEHTENNQIQGEIYIKIVSSDKELKNVYWYVLLVCKNGDMYATLIDAKTGEIIQN